MPTSSSGASIPAGFAGGSLHLAPARAAESIRQQIGAPLDLEDTPAALSISEMVDENMANAARVHAVEWGKDIAARTMIAFGGAAPLHAARLAQKLDVRRVIVPTGAGVGSAIGMLRAAVSYEVVRSRYVQLAEFDPDSVNALLAEMNAEARAVVVAGVGAGAQLEEARHAYMRYVGQGHEIVVALPVRELGADDGATLAAAFDAEYARLYGRTIPDQEREVLSWTLTVTAARPSLRTTVGTASAAAAADSVPDAPSGTTVPGSAEPRIRKLFDPILADYVEAAVRQREELDAESSVTGSAVIVEDQTTTVVPNGFTASVNRFGYLVLERVE